MAIVSAGRETAGIVWKVLARAGDRPAGGATVVEVDDSIVRGI